MGRRPWVLYAQEDRYINASPRGHINCWSGTEVGLTLLGAPNIPIIVGLTSLLLYYINKSPRNFRQGPGSIFQRWVCRTQQQTDFKCFWRKMPSMRKIKNFELTLMFAVDEQRPGLWRDRIGSAGDESKAGRSVRSDRTSVPRYTETGTLRTSAQCTGQLVSHKNSNSLLV